MNNLGDGVRSEVDREVGVRRLLVDVINAGEALDLAVPGSLVQASSVDLLTPLERSRDVDEEVVSTSTGNLVLDGLSGGGVRGSRGGDDGGTGLGELGGDKADSEEVEVLVLVRRAQLGGKLVSNVLAQEERDGSGTVLLQRDLQGAGDRVLARVVQARQQD